MTDIVQKTVGLNDLYVIDESNNTLVVDQTNGRIGINNTNPGYSLTVTGATHTTANLSAGTDLFLVDEANSRISIGTTTGVSGFVLNVSGNTTLVGTLKLGSNLTHYNNTAPAAGQLLIGDATAGVWDAATLTAGTNVTITNADGAITIAASGGGGGVTSVATSAPITGGTITGTGTIGITQASGSADGYLSSANWTTFNNKLATGDNVSTLTNDANYINSQQIGNFAPPVAPPVAPAFADSPTGGPLNPAGWLEIDVGLGPMYIPVYQ